MVWFCWADSGISASPEDKERQEMYKSAFTYDTDFSYGNTYVNWNKKNVYTRTAADDEAKLAEIKPNSVVELIFIGLSFLALLCTFPFSLFFSLKFVSDFERLVVLRLGRAQNVRGPGTFLVLPFIDKSVKIDMRINPLELPNISIITCDKGIVEFASAIFIKIIDPVMSYCNFQDKDTTIKNLGYTAIYKHMARRTLHDITNPHDLSKILYNVQAELNKFTLDLGVEVAEVTVTKIIVHKEAENQAVALFNTFMKSEVGTSVFQSLQSQLLENVVPKSNFPTQTVPAQPTREKINAEVIVDKDIEELLLKIRQCCDSNLVNKVGKCYRIICFGEDNAPRGDFLVDLKAKDGWATWTAHATDLLNDVDVTFSLSKQSLFSLVNGELSPFSAYMNGLIQISGSVSDAAGLKHLMERAQELRCI
uniref:Band 7 domain-containing protein n=1 Tax=Panagrolaimus sp. JU765 TaxID=591449 RepID=A0AC34R0A4_9BILA